MKQLEQANGMMSAPKLWNTYPQSVQLQTHSPACSRVSSALRPCSQQPCTLCAQFVSSAQYGPPPICRHDGDDNAVASSFRGSHAKHTRMELLATRLPCSCFPHAPLRPLGMRVLFFKQFAAANGIFYFFVQVSISLTANGSQRARLSIPRTATLPSCLYSRGPSIVR